MIQGHPLYYLTPPYTRTTPMGQAASYLEEIAQRHIGGVLESGPRRVRLNIGISDLLFVVRSQSDESHSTIDVKLKLDLKYSTLASITFFEGHSLKQPLPRVVVKTPARKSAGLLALMHTRNRSAIRSDLVDRAKTT